MERPPPDPRKLLNEWMEWERGEATPGRVMANLKTGGIRDLLEVLAEQAEAMKGAAPDASASADAAGSSSPDHADPSSDAAPAWTPTV